MASCQTEVPGATGLPPRACPERGDAEQGQTGGAGMDRAAVPARHGAAVPAALAPALAALQGFTQSKAASKREPNDAFGCRNVRNSEFSQNLVKGRSVACCQLEPTPPTAGQLGPSRRASSSPFACEGPNHMCLIRLTQIIPV